LTAPSGTLLKGFETIDTVDDAGRVLAVRPPHALDQLRLFKAVGPTLAQNQPYLGMAMVACAVTAIDGVPIPTPVNEHQIENLIQRLGDAGLRAASAVLEPQPSEDEVRDRAGNSAGTPI
jgi:N-acetyl-beta-hexosaminidase